MKGYKILIKRGSAWNVFYVWARDENCAEIVAKCHVIAGVPVDRR